MATSMDHLYSKCDPMSKKIVTLEGLDDFKFGFSDANDPNEDLQVKTLVRIGSQIKEISIWAQRIVKQADKELKAAGLLYKLGKTSMDRSEGDERNYELHVMLPGVGLAYNPKLRRVLHACTGIERLILDRVTNSSIFLNHNYPKLKEIEAYVMEDVYVLELVQHYPTVQSVQLPYRVGCFVKRLAAVKHVTDIKLVCECDHVRDFFRLVREQPKITFIEVTLTKNIEANLLANLDFFPNLKKISVHFADDFEYGETFKNFLLTRGHMLELLTIDTDDFVDVPRLILDHSRGMNQLACRFRLKSTHVSKDQLEVIFKIPVRREKVITFKALNSKQRKRIEKLVQQVKPESVPYKMNVHVVTDDEFHVGAFDDLRSEFGM